MKVPSPAEAASLSQATPPPVPGYLQAIYWWAYIHPRGVRIFERQWLVSLILWGNYRKLCDAALQSLANLQGRTLQIACAYGDLTPRLAAKLGTDDTLDVIDILPIQLENLKHKLHNQPQTALHLMDSTSLQFTSGHFERALLFFLLHEQPPAVRRQTLAEALRVIKSGGTLTIVDYAGPGRHNLLRYLMAPVLRWLEPHALDLWEAPIPSWFAPDARFTVLQHRRFFGGLYQLLTLRVE